jgi:alkanesulfonate monooxygenase SsuD/methylene tetrahydromethanopterin reductase-like flavin-dependent oxidoreductase (luciferase family)
MLPRPVRGHMPLWIGGVGEKRTLEMVARYADGWNAAYAAPEEFARLGRVLDQHCERLGRDPTTIERSINLMFDLGKGVDELAAQWGPMWERVRGGSLHGDADQAAGRLAEYRDAGADLVNVALRAPVDLDLLDAYLTEIAPALRG